MSKQVAGARPPAGVAAVGERAPQRKIYSKSDLPKTLRRYTNFLDEGKYIVSDFAGQPKKFLTRRQSLARRHSTPGPHQATRARQERDKNYRSKNSEPRSNHHEIRIIKKAPDKIATKTSATKLPQQKFRAVRNGKKKTILASATKLPQQKITLH